jgi:hypothetical protein
MQKMIVKTNSEILFENFCNSNQITWEKIEKGSVRTPDYRVFFEDQVVYIEVKQIDRDDNFSAGFSSRTVGSHIREKIKEARSQVKAGSSTSSPSILIVYNNLDPMQMFGTSEHDFITAMYGEMTLDFNKAENRVTDSFYGRNRSFSEDRSVYFSALGFLSNIGGTISVQIYENVFAQNPLDFSKIPSCIKVTRVNLSGNTA